MTFEERLNIEIPRLEKFCTRMVGIQFGRDQDVLQNTIGRAWRSQATFKEDCQMYTWLCTIATNIFRDLIRNESRGINPDSLDKPFRYLGQEMDSTFHDVVSKDDPNYIEVERDGITRSIIDTILTPGTACHRTALESIIYGMSVKEIEERHGISPNAARSRVFRANDMIRKAVEQNPDLLVEYGVYA